MNSFLPGNPERELGDDVTGRRFRTHGSGSGDSGLVTGPKSGSDFDVRWLRPDMTCEIDAFFK